MSLIMIGSYARRAIAEDCPWGIEKEKFDDFIEIIRRDWGGPIGLNERAPSVANDDRFRRWWARYLRLSASPATAVALTQSNGEIDVRHILPSIRVPTLIIHAKGDRAIKFEQGQHLSEQIPDDLSSDFCPLTSAFTTHKASGSQIPRR